LFVIVGTLLLFLLSLIAFIVFHCRTVGWWLLLLLPEQQSSTVG
jgi:hypothetical protein